MSLGFIFFLFFCFYLDFNLDEEEWECLCGVCVVY